MTPQAPNPCRKCKGEPLITEDVFGDIAYWLECNSKTAAPLGVCNVGPTRETISDAILAWNEENPITK